jgi:molecular chaperone GrpE
MNNDEDIIQHEPPGDDDVILDPTDDQNQELGNQSKIADLRKKLNQALKERDDYLAQLQRERADSINVRKTEEAKRDNLKSLLVTDMCERLLPVLDSFDAAMGNRVAWESVDPNWRIGVEYIYQQLVGVLDSYGVTSQNPIGEQFDAEAHEPHDYRVTQDEAGVGKIVEVLQKGYKHKDTIIRPARVIVGTLEEQ